MAILHYAMHSGIHYHCDGRGTGQKHTKFNCNDIEPHAVNCDFGKVVSEMLN